MNVMKYMQANPHTIDNVIKDHHMEIGLNLIIKKYLILIFTILLIFTLSGFEYEDSFGEESILDSNLGKVTEILPDGNNIYFFEIDKNIKSDVWVYDTMLMINDGNTTRSILQEKFISPMELTKHGDYLYFTVLSDDCIGMVRCDFQDLVRISKVNSMPEKEIMIKHLRAVAHIAVDDDSLLVSESDGKIWHVSQDFKKEVVLNTDNIIMDLEKDGQSDTIYWIEEVSQDNNRILALKPSGGTYILDSQITLPSNLKVINGVLYWNEVETKTIGSGFPVSYTIIKRVEDGKQPKTIFEFQNTSPIFSAKQKSPNYGAFTLAENAFIFLANNTKGNNHTIHLLNMQNGTSYHIKTISEYEIEYIRTDDTSLFVVGQSKDGSFVIEKLAIPIPIPEFSTYVFPITITGLTLIVFLRKFFRY